MSNRTRPPFTQPRTNLAATMKRNAEKRQCPSCERKAALVTTVEGATACKWCDYYKAPKEWEV